MSNRISIFELTKDWKLLSSKKLEKEILKFMLKNRLTREEILEILNE